VWLISKSLDLPLCSLRAAPYVPNQHAIDLILPKHRTPSGALEPMQQEHQLFTLPLIQYKEQTWLSAGSAYTMICTNAKTVEKIQ
jgi:hypothetical protein